MMRAALLVALAALAACTLEPRYERPAAPVRSEFAEPSTQYTSPAAAQGEPRAAADIGWREVFPQPELQGLIERALANNRDLRVAALNVDEARARYRVRRADLFPAVDVQATGSSQRVPAVLSQTGTGYVARQYEIAAGFTAFEVDVFGRVRSLKNAALEDYLALDETRAAVQISLVGEVARAWLALVADEDLLHLTQETLANQRSSLEIVQMRVDAGVAREIDLHQAEIAVRSAEVNGARYVRQIAQDRNALELLVGEPLPQDLRSAGRDLGAEVFAGELPPGLPADLLERRPDIRAAEHDLRAATADIGAARAAFFPSVTLTGAGGRAHSDLDRLFDDGQRVWSFMPRINVPIFAGGANRANLDVAQVRKRIEVAQYERTIQNAFREVADALAAQSTLEDELRAQTGLAQSAESAYRLADLRYRGGIDSYLTTLIAQRDTYAAQLALVSARLARAANRVQLYEALGGGWKAD
jgi:multidrug efflux system outer membrane protein